MPDGPGVVAPSPNLGLISAAVCASVLLLSAVGHVRTGTLRYELDAHGVIPVRLRRFVSGSVPLAEAFLALVIAGSLILSDSVLRLALGFGGVLFGCYGAYAMAVRYRSPEIRTGCGCGVGEHPIGVSTAVKAVALIVLTAAGALAGGPVLRTGGLLISVLMGISAVCLLIWLPVSLSRPDQLTEEQSR